MGLAIIRLFFIISLLIVSMFLWGCSHVAIQYTYDMKLLDEGDAKFNEKNYPEAVKKYNEVLKSFPRRPSARMALYKIGYSYIYYENPQNDWTAALKAFRRFEKEYADDPKIEEVKTWSRMLVIMESFASQYTETSVRVQKIKNNYREKITTAEQWKEEFQRCSSEKDSLSTEKSTLIQKIKELEATILKYGIEKTQ